MGHNEFSLAVVMYHQMWWEDDYIWWIGIDGVKRSHGLFETAIWKDWENHLKRSHGLFEGVISIWKDWGNHLKICGDSQGSGWYLNLVSPEHEVKLELSALLML
jgi:hypothetical protein